MSEVCCESVFLFPSHICLHCLINIIFVVLRFCFSSLSVSETREKSEKIKAASALILKGGCRRPLSAPSGSAGPPSSSSRFYSRTDLLHFSTDSRRSSSGCQRTVRPAERRAAAVGLWL